MTQQTDPIVQAWQEAVQAEVRIRPWFAALLLQKGNQLLARFATFYARLTAVGQQTRRRLAVGVGTAALALALSSAPTPAHAATITVGPDCTLVQAIISANTDAVASGSSCTAGSGADTIVLAGGTYSYTTANGYLSALPHITTPITIEANGATIQRTDGGANMRIITITSGSSLTLNNATITGGNVSTSGGGIYVSLNSTLIINNSTISGNTAGVRGGGISNHSTMTSTLNNSTVSGNTATNDGGGINKSGAGTLILNNSTVSDNTSTSGAGGGVHNFSSTISLNRSIVSGNTASTNREINITDSGATANVDNFNIIGHSGDSGSNVTINSPTIVPSGALNTVLSPLADNGGPTLTHALVAGSPAIDIILTTDPACDPGVSVDQRGAVRADGVNRGGTACDAGSFEYDSNQTPSAVTLQSITAINQQGGLAALMATLLTALSGIWLWARRPRQAQNEA